MNNRGVFGLTSVQQFFAIILGVALLAYVIVVIMGTLNNSSIIPTGTVSNTVTGESAFLNSTGDLLNSFNVTGFTNPSIVSIINTTSGLLIAAPNYTLVGATLFNATAVVWPAVTVNYTFGSNSQAANNVNTILANTSSGISGFFSAINPVYAILAILVIILVLVVLVRVVTGDVGTGRVEYNPQL